MHRSLLIALSAFWITPAIAQRTEVSAVLSSGFFSLTGAATASSTVISGSDGANSARTYNPRGSQNGFCDGASIAFKYISKSHLILGLDAGFEALRSKISIRSIYGYAKDGTTYTYAATGSSQLRLTFLNFAPFIGYRQPVKRVNVDYTAGFDLGYCLDANERGQATDVNGKEYEIASKQHGGPESGDIRLRFQISTYFHRFGVFGGYSIGLTDYIQANTGRSSDCKSRLIRFGISYRINTPVQ